MSSDDCIYTIEINSDHDLVAAKLRGCVAPSEVESSNSDQLLCGVRNLAKAARSGKWVG